MLRWADKRHGQHIRRLAALLVALGGLTISACQSGATVPRQAQEPAPGAAVSAVGAGAPGVSKPAQESPSSIQKPQAYSGFEQRDIPPDFNLKILANGTGTQSLRALVGPDNKNGLDGVVVAFTASWCGRCKASYPTLESLQKEHAGRLKILLLTAEKEPEGRAKMVEVVKQEKLTLPLLEAPPELVDLWLGEAQNIPRFYLIDYKGMVRVKDTGFGSKMAKLLPNQIEFLLGRREYEKTNPPPG